MFKSPLTSVHNQSLFLKKNIKDILKEYLIEFGIGIWASKIRDLATMRL